MKRSALLLLAIAVAFGFASGAQAAEKLKTVASFSILGDMVKNVGGDRIELVTLVGPDGDAHVFQPTPADARTLANADLLFINGLGFEGWMERLEKSSGFKGKVVTASAGVTPLDVAEERAHGDEVGEDHDEHAKHENGHEDHDEHAKHEDGHDDHARHEDEPEHAEKQAGHDGHHHGDVDPHAWQNLANGEVYVATIRDALITADPEDKEIYAANAAKYLDALAKEDKAVKEAVAKLPPDRRKIITSHDAFAYFGAAYGLEIIAPEGVSTESEASAQEVAKIIRQINAEKIPAVFLENVTDRRLLDQIARETGAKIGGVLYSDALSKPDGPAPTYLDMFRHNIEVLSQALSS